MKNHYKIYDIMINEYFFNSEIDQLNNACGFPTNQLIHLQKCSNEGMQWRDRGIIDRKCISEHTTNDDNSPSKVQLFAT